MSSVVVSVPLVSAAPTAITNGSYAGLATLAVVAPSLPAEATTTMPLPPGDLDGVRQRVERYVLRAQSVPKERLSTRMFRPGSSRCCDHPVDRGDHLRHVDGAVGGRRP